MVYAPKLVTPSVDHFTELMVGIAVRKGLCL